MWRRLVALFSSLVLGGAIYSVSAGSDVVLTPDAVTGVASGTRLSGVKYGLGSSDLVDVWFPDAPPVGVIVWFHGGGWIAGSRTTTFVHDIPTWLLSRGWVIVAADYRLTHVNKFGATVNAFPAAVNDAQRAIKWTERHLLLFGAPRRILLAGASSGANIALVAALAGADVSNVRDAPPSVDGVLSIVGPTDVEAMYLTHAPIFSAAAALYGGCNFQLVGGTSRNCVRQDGFAASIWRAGVSWNLVHAAAAGKRIPPVYFIGGGDDSVVDPTSQIDPIAPLWRTLAGDDRFVETDVVQDAGHNFTLQMIDSRKLANWLARIASGDIVSTSRAATPQPLQGAHLGTQDDQLLREPLIAR